MSDIDFLSQPIPAFFVPQRRLTSSSFDVTADVTVEEMHDDRLVITEHPVEQGAQITDHAYKEPSRLRLTLGWSNSNLAAGFDPNYVKDQYQLLRDMQVSRELIKVVTGKFTYENMLIENLREITTEKTEYALMAVMDMQQIILVDTSTTAVPPSANQADPQDTGAVQDMGTLQPQFVSGLATALGTFN